MGNGKEKPRGWGEKTNRLESLLLGVPKTLKKAKKGTKQKEVILKEVEDVIFTLRQYVISKHVNGFQKALRQAKFLYKEVSTTDCCFSVNMDLYDSRMLNVEKIVVAKAAKHANENIEGDNIYEWITRLNPSLIVNGTVD